MGLSNELISQFAKITNDRKVSRIDEATLYGEVVEYDNMLCVKFDGSEEITPVTTVVEKDDDGNIINYKYGAASVKTGDRVSVNLKNHSATITGNLSDPPPSRAEFNVGEDSILARVDDVSLRIDTLGITVNGLTTFTNGLSNGSTSIDGGCIKTGTIDASRLNLSGSITFGDLATDAADKINGAVNAANNAQSAADAAQSAADAALSTAEDANAVIENWGYTYGGTTYIDGQKILTGTVTASTLQGGSIQLLDRNELVAADFGLTGASSYNGRKLLVESGAIELSAQYGSIFLESGYQTWLQIGDDVACKGDLRPNSSNSWSVGTSGYKWTDIYCSNGTIVTSDAEKKKDINHDLTKYDSFFNSLSPCTYKFVDGESGRTHLGMISQDVEKALVACDISAMEFAGFVKSPRKNEDGKYDYALRYTEFIPLLVWQVQKLKARVAELEETNG